MKLPKEGKVLKKQGAKPCERDYSFSRFCLNTLLSLSVKPGTFQPGTVIYGGHGCCISDRLQVSPNACLLATPK